MFLLNNLLLDVQMGPSVEDIFTLLLYLAIFSLPVVIVVWLILKSKSKDQKGK